MALWFDVFRTGTHTDSAGTEREWTTEDLDTMVAAYNASSQEAPLVLGHPGTDDPAFGWITKLERAGDILRAKAERIAPELIDWVRQGYYKNVSIALYPNLLLKHIGLLGAVPPAVKGLTPPQFAENPEGIVTFSTEPFKGSLTALLRKEHTGTQPADELREYLSVKAQNGYITPAQREAATRLGEMLLLAGSIQFTEESEKISPLLRFLDLMPRQMFFTETRETPPVQNAASFNEAAQRTGTAHLQAGHNQAGHEEASSFLKTSSLIRNSMAGL